MAITYTKQQSCLRNFKLDLTDLVDVELLIRCLEIQPHDLVRYIDTDNTSHNFSRYAVCITDFIGDFDVYELKNFQVDILVVNNNDKPVIPNEWFLKMYITNSMISFKSLDVSIDAPSKFLEEISNLIDRDTIKDCSIEDLNQMIDMFYDVFNENDRIKIEYYKVMIKHIKDNLTSLL